MVKLIEKGTTRIKDKDFEANYDKAALGMTQADMIDAYRNLPRDDPFRDYLRDKIVEKVAVPEMSKTQSAIAGATDTMSLGMSDEINGLLAVLGGGSYEGEIGAQRQMQRTAQKDNPKTYLTGQIAGAVPMAVASAGTLPAATTLPRMAALGAAEGASQGAAYGAGSGEGTADRLWQAIEQGLIGGGLGAAGPYIGRGVGAVYRSGRDAIKNSSTAQKAANSVWQMLEDNNLTLADARAAIQKLGQNGSLADISDGMRVEAAGTATADTGAQSIMANRYGARDAGMGGRVSSSLDEGFGPFRDPQAIEDSVKALKKSTGPAYRLAEQHVVDAESAVEAIRRLQKKYGPNSDTGQALQKYYSQLVDAQGNIIGEGNIVHGVRQEIDTAIKRGNLANSSPFQEVRDELDAVLKGQIPGFAEADKIYSGASKVQEAFDYGQNELMTSKTFPGQNDARWAKMSDAEKEAVMQGTRADLEMSMSGRPNPGQRAERKLSQNMNDKKVGPMLEARKPGSYQKLRDALDAEQTMRETNDLVQATRGSRTAPVSAAADRRWGRGGGGILPGLTEAVGQAGTATAAGGPAAGLFSLAAQGTSAGFRKALQKMTGVNSKVVAEAGDILSRMGPEAMRSVQQIETVLKSRGISADQAKVIANGVQRLIKGSVYVNATTGPTSGGVGR